MRIGRLAVYIAIAVTSATFGFLLGGGKIPDDLSETQQTLAAQARATADEFEDQETALTEMLNYVRDRVSESVGQVGWFQHDDQ